MERARRKARKAKHRAELQERLGRKPSKQEVIEWIKKRKRGKAASQEGELTEVEMQQAVEDPWAEQATALKEADDAYTEAAAAEAAALKEADVAYAEAVAAEAAAAEQLLRFVSARKARRKAKRRAELQEKLRREPSKQEVIDWIKKRKRDKAASQEGELAKRGKDGKVTGASLAADESLSSLSSVSASAHIPTFTASAQVGDHSAAARGTESHPGVRRSSRLAVGRGPIGGLKSESRNEKCGTEKEVDGAAVQEKQRKRRMTTKKVDVHEQDCHRSEARIASPALQALTSPLQAPADSLPLVPSANNQSGYKNVYANLAGWFVNIKKGGRIRRLGGIFYSAEAAAAAYSAYLGAEQVARELQPQPQPRVVDPAADGADAVRLAVEEGLTLEKSDTTAGFKGVYLDRASSKHKCSKKKFKAQVTDISGPSKRTLCLGFFASAERAALVYTRWKVERYGTPEAVVKTTEAEVGPVARAAAALEQAAAEGLSLEASLSTTGLKGVYLNKAKRVKPYNYSAVFTYRDQQQCKQRQRHLGCFMTKEEAALAYQREVYK